MKKSLIILLLCVGFMTIGCENKTKENDGKNYKQYEIHFYDADFKHTEELEVYYDKDGNLKNIAAYYVYDASKNRNCQYIQKPKKDYKDAKIECTENSDGSVKYYSYLTDESIKEGALEDSAFMSVKSAYEEFDTEEKIKSYIDSLIEELKNSNTKSDDRNYIISDGKKVEW